MIGRIAKELRQKRSRSAKRWQRAQQKKRRLESKLEKIEQQLKADLTLNCYGILIDVHHLRSPQGKAENRFQFFRKHRRGMATDYGDGDLEALEFAVNAAKEYRTKATHKVGLELPEGTSFARKLAKFTAPRALGEAKQ